MENDKRDVLYTNAAVIDAYFDWEEKQLGVITNCEAFQAGVDYAATLRQQAGSFDAVHSLPALWRQIEVSDESQTEFDKGYEQASRECADALQATLAQNTQEKAIGIVHDFGALDWLGGNCPKAGTKLYTHAERATVPDADAARFRFVVEHNWIGAKTRCERRIQDSDLGSARQAVDAASLAAPSQPEDAA